MHIRYHTWSVSCITLIRIVFFLPFMHHDSLVSCQICTLSCNAICILSIMHHMQQCIAAYIICIFPCIYNAFCNFHHSHHAINIKHRLHHSSDALSNICIMDNVPLILHVLCTINYPLGMCMRKCYKYICLNSSTTVWTMSEETPFVETV